jgi:hypothetical protein
LFRTNYQKTRKNFEQLAEKKLNGEDDKDTAGTSKVLKGKASRQQKRLDDWLTPKNVCLLFSFLKKNAFNILHQS